MELYDDLIGGVPSGLTVDRCLVGRGWTAVSTGEGMGLAMTYHDDISEIPQQGTLVGRPLEDLMALAHRWGLGEAGIGVAAFNAYYNTREHVESWTGRSVDELATTTSFSAMEDEVRGKKVAVIGHFPGLDKLAPHCELSIFERRPTGDDLPDYAEEYLLPEQDYVFITGATLVNKTLPRLLELSQNATVALVGPTVPLTPVLFDWGIDVLGGSIVLEDEGVWQAVAEGGIRNIWKRGAVTVQVKAEDFR